MKKKSIISLFIVMNMLLSLVVPAMANDLYEMQMKFTSGGEEITSIANLTGFDAELTVTKAAAENQNAAIIIAEYANGGALKKVTKTPISILKSDEVQNFTASISGIVPSENNYAKAYVWDMQTMTPLCNAFTPTEPNNLSVSLDGVYSLYNKVSAKVENAASGDISYEWLYSDTEDGEYKAMDSAVGEYSLLSDGGATIQLLQGAESITTAATSFGQANPAIPAANADGSDYTWLQPTMATGAFDGENAICGKYIKVRVTDSKGKSAESAPRKVEEKLGAPIDSTNTNWNNAEGWSSEYDGKYDFDVDGKSFTLLDTAESKASHYLVVANDLYGNYNYNFGGQYYGSGWTSQTFYTFAHYMNGKGSNLGLPENIMKYIDNEHYWSAELPMNVPKGGMYQFAVKAGIAVPSETEIAKYGKKMTGLTGSGFNHFWLRTPGTNNQGNMKLVNPGAEEKRGTFVHTIDSGIRPIFWLDRDFFKEVKIDNGGSELMNMIAAEYSEEELNKIYGTTPLTKVSTKGIYELYNTVSAETDYNGLKPLTYTWLYSDIIDGEYKALDTLVGDTSLVSEGGKSIRLLQGAESITSAAPSFGQANPAIPAYNADGSDFTWLQPTMATGAFDGSNAVCGKYIKVRVTDSKGKTVESEPRKVADKSGEATTEKNYQNRLGWSSAYDGSYDFEIDGKSFTLLDSTESDSSRYFVIANDTYGNYSYNFGGQWGQSWVNQTFYTFAHYMNGTGSNLGLPENVKEHIDNNHYWLSEQPVNVPKSGMYQFAVKTGIAVPSAAELFEYGPKISKLSGDYAWFWTRTPSGDGTSTVSASDRMVIVNPAAQFVLDATIYSNSGAIRPVFYLDKDFFKTVKIGNAGANLIEQIKQDYSSGELESLYGTSDYDTVMSGGTVGNFSLSGIFESYQTIGFDAASLNLSSPAYKWERADKPNGEFMAIDGETAEVYTTSAADAGKYIRLVITDGADEYVSTAKFIESFWNFRQVNGSIKNVLKNSKAEYEFSVDGKQYLLLNTTGNSDAMYLIMSKQCADQRPFTDSIATQTQILTTNDGVVGKWLNEDYFNSLPAAMRETIDKNHTWKIDIPMWNYDNETTITAGIVLPAVNDLKKYKNIIGMGDADSESWWTRSPYGRMGDDGNWVMNVSYKNGEAVLKGTHSTATSGVRPIFYANSGFFNKVKLSSAGSEVLKHVQKSALYSDTEWKALNQIIKNGIIINISKNFDSKGKTADMSVSFDVERMNSAEYTISYSCNGAAEEPIKVAVDKKIKDTIPLTFPDIKNGTNNIFVSVECDGNTIVSKATETLVTSGYTGEVGDAATMKGYVGFMGYNGTDFLENSVKSGAKISRTNINWNQIEDGQSGRGKGEYDWDEMDSVMMPLLENGIEPIVLLTYDNKQFYGVDEDTKQALWSKEEIDGMAAYAKAVALHYKEKGYTLKYFEFWNEPNAKFWLPLPLGHATYTEAMKVVTNSIKSVLPEAVVIGGALSHNDPRWMKWLNANVYEFADGFSYHPYVSGSTSKVYIDNAGDGEAASFVERCEAMNDVGLKYGGWKQNWITEFGVSSNKSEYGFTEEEQASELVKESILADSANVDANTVYSYMNWYNPSASNVDNDYESNWGIVKNNGDLKKSYVSMQAMMNILGGAAYIGKIEENGTDMYVYLKNGKTIAAVWNKTNATLNLQGTAAIVDLNGNIVSENASSADITNEPKYLLNLSAYYLNRALASTYSQRITNDLSAAGLDSLSASFDSVKAKVSQIAFSSDVQDLSDIISEHYAAAASIAANRGALTDSQLSSALYIIHNAGKYLLGYTMINNSAPNAAKGRADYENLLASVKEKENLTIAGLMPYTRAILTMADRYLTYAEKTAKQTGDYAASVSKAYYAIADKIIGMAELMLANETAGSDNLSIQIPYYDQKLNLYDTDGNKSEDRYYPCTLKVTVYNFGETAIENATLELQNNKGRAIGTGTFSLAAGESIQVPIEIKYAGKLDTLFGTTLSTGKTVYTFLKAVAKQNGNVFAERFVEVSKDNYQIGILTE